MAVAVAFLLEVARVLCPTILRRRAADTMSDHPPEVDATADGRAI